MNGFTKNIAEALWLNKSFRKVLYTTQNSQLVLMHLNPNEDIGEEVHDVDQILSVGFGTGKVVLNGVESPIETASVVVVPKGVRHNLVNTSPTEPMKIYTVYCPPHHRDGVEHTTRTDAEKDTEHFDGKTTE